MAASPERLRPATSMSEKPGLRGAVSRFWQRSYASDYLSIAILLTCYILIQMFIEPFHRMFSLSNLSIQYPHALHERVPVLWLFILASGVPLASLLLWTIFARPSAHKSHVTFLGLFVSIILTLFLTDTIKNAVGRPRPDLLARCKPAPGTDARGLVTVDVCTETDHHTLHDGWRSFPSGHSSFAFSGLGYLSIFLGGQLAVFRPRTDLSRVLLALAPLLGALLIAISRCEDYRHDVYDVTVGSALGFTVAYATYRRYYPSLTSRRCDKPYSLLPNDGSNGASFKKRDEEASIRSAEEFELDDLAEDDDEAYEERRPLRTANRDT